MATKTTNMGLIKPEGTDSPPDITTLNQNWDRLDQEVPSKVSKNGDTIEGNLFIQRSAFPQLILRDTTQQRDGFFQYAENGLLFMQNIPLNGNGNDRSLVILGNENSGNEELLRVAKINAGSWQTFGVYHEGHKPTPAEIGASRSLQASTTVEVGAGKTFTTIADALGSLPKNLGGYNATILVSAGTYTGTLSISGFYGGQLIIKAADESNQPVLNGKIYVGNCACLVSFEGFKVLDSSGDYCVAADYAVRLYMLRMTLSGPVKGSGRGLRLSSVSGGLVDACVFENLNIGVATTYGSRLSLYSPTVRNCVTGFYANASTVHIGGGTISTVDISHTTEQGGRIYTGSQTAVPNY